MAILASFLGLYHEPSFDIFPVSFLILLWIVQISDFSFQKPKNVIIEEEQRIMNVEKR